MLVAASVLHAQTDRPLTTEELQRQVESLSPSSADPGRATSSRMTVPGSTPKGPRPSASMQPSLFPGDNPLPNGGAPAKAAKPEKKSKGPTEIVALEATFDQKTHLAVFIGQVVVTDPEFNVVCDKLTAYLKHNDKPAPGDPAAPRPKATPTPPPATPTGKKGDKGSDKGGGLEKAIAEADPGKIVTVTQDKTEADGTVSHSIGHGRRAEYVAATGDITLIGRPDVQQGINTCVATDDSTIITLNRDGHMRVNGPHKTVIKDQGELTK